MREHSYESIETGALPFSADAGDKPTRDPLETFDPLKTQYGKETVNASLETERSAAQPLRAVELVLNFGDFAKPLSEHLQSFLGDLQEAELWTKVFINQAEGRNEFLHAWASNSEFGQRIRYNPDTGHLYLPNHSGFIQLFHGEKFLTNLLALNFKPYQGDSNEQKIAFLHDYQATKLHELDTAWEQVENFYKQYGTNKLRAANVS